MGRYTKTVSFIGTICYYIALAIFFIFYFPVFIFIYIFISPFDRKKSVMHYASMYFCMMIIRLCPFWDVEVSGTEKIDRDKTYIIASNHQSMMDIPLIGHTIPLIFRYVSKREVYKIPIIGWVLWLRDDIGIERGGAQSAKKMLLKAKELVNKKVSIMIFPEGTRTRSGRVEEFKEGAFMMAKSNALPVLPIVIEGTWEVSNYFGNILKMPTKFQLTVLDPIPAEEIKAMKVREITQKVESIIRSAHEEIKPNIYKNNN